MKFYRAAASVNPALGFTSFWTPDKETAKWFADWLTNPDSIYVFLGVARLPLKRPDEIAIYVADVDPADVEELFPPGGVLPIAPEKVLAQAYKYMARGVQWVLFQEGFRGRPVVAIGHLLRIGAGRGRAPRVTLTNDPSILLAIVSS